MTTTTIRKRLLSFIADADEKKVKGMYLLFEDEIEKNGAFKLTDEQKKFLDVERDNHLKGKSKSYTLEESKKFISRKKSS